MESAGCVMILVSWRLCDSIFGSRIVRDREGYTMVHPGRYRHYKGQEYEVLGVATHSETEEEFVVYRALYGRRDLWIRPLAMFLETVVVDGRPFPRFQKLSDEPTASTS